MMALKLQIRLNPQLIASQLVEYHNLLEVATLETQVLRQLALKKPRKILRAQCNMTIANLYHS
jgi:hypothetical protein